MLDWIVAMAMGAALALGIGGLERWRRASKRASAAMPPADETVLRLDDGRPTRLYVDRNLPTGARAGLVNLTSTSLVLTDARLILGTHHGRVLEATRAHPIAFRCVGPRRLVAEGIHPDGRTNIRLEIIVDDPEGWVSAVSEVVGPVGAVGGARDQGGTR